MFVVLLEFGGVGWLLDCVCVLSVVSFAFGEFACFWGLWPSICWLCLVCLACLLGLVVWLV